MSDPEPTFSVVQCEGNEQGQCPSDVVEFCLDCGLALCERHWRVHDCARESEK